MVLISFTSVAAVYIVALVRLKVELLMKNNLELKVIGFLSFRIHLNWRQTGVKHKAQINENDFVCKDFDFRVNLWINGTAVRI